MKAEDTVMSKDFAKTLILTKHCSPETRPTDIAITDVEETLIEAQAEISFKAGLREAMQWIKKEKHSGYFYYSFDQSELESKEKEWGVK